MNEKPANTWWTQVLGAGLEGAAASGAGFLGGVGSALKGEAAPPPTNPISAATGLTTTELVIGGAAIVALAVYWR